MQPPPLEQPLSEAARISGVFLRPRRAFADIVARPRWFPPVIVVAIFSLAFLTCYSQRVGMTPVFARAMDSNPRTHNMPPEEREMVTRILTTVGAVAVYGATVVEGTIRAVMVAAILMFVLNRILGLRSTYPEMLAITAYSQLTTVVAAVLMAFSLYLKPAGEFDLANPPGPNVRAFLGSAAEPAWLFSLASSLDLFSFWTIWLLALGISVAARITVRRAAGAVIATWAVWSAVKSAWSAIFG